MRVSEVFARGGGDYGYNGHNGGFERYLPYVGVYKSCGYYPDTGRWAYVHPNDYNWRGCRCGYGASRSFELVGVIA